ncbi:MAG: winged helix-turn-helix domain-containing protein [Actinomycetota bacterium]|nr:winged helix-turn-helix domain-containing protein [Actinomycetota bacterium]
MNSGPAHDHARVIDLAAHPLAAPNGSGLSAPAEPVLLVGAQPWWEHSGLDAALQGAGWAWLTAGDPSRARWIASIRRVSLVAIGGDRTMRWDAAREIRAVTNVPVVVLTDDPAEIGPFIAAGVDAVVDASEPGDTSFARLVALLRRADHRWGPSVRYLQSDDLTVDLWTQQCTRGGQPLPLSPTEYALLTFLMTRPDVALPIATIVRRVWEWMPSDGRNALRIIVNRLRRKLDDDPRHPQFVASVRGIGYRFVANVTEVADTVAEHPDRVDVTPLLDSISRLAGRLADPAEVLSPAEQLLRIIDGAGLADGVALFRRSGNSMHLVGERRMPAAWLERVAGGVPLDPSFAGAQSMLSNEVVQFADVRAVGQFKGTAGQLAAEGFRACHFVPIAHGGEVWGHLGIVRRSAQPLDAVAMSYLRALCSLFLLHIHATELG